MEMSKNIGSFGSAMFGVDGDPAASLMVLLEIVQQTCPWTITGELEYTPASCLSLW